MTADFGVNQGLVEEQFLKWVDNPRAVAEAWRSYFESLAPDELPQLSSAGTILAPVTSVGLLSPEPESVPPPLPSSDNGAPVARAASEAPSTEGADAPEDDDEGARNSVFYPPTTETVLDPVLPDNPAILSRQSFPPSSELLVDGFYGPRRTAVVLGFGSVSRGANSDSTARSAGSIESRVALSSASCIWKKFSTSAGAGIQTTTAFLNYFCNL